MAFVATATATMEPSPSPSLPHDCKTKKRWKCDVCKVARFASFEEACRHEEQCLRRQLDDDDNNNDDDGETHLKAVQDDLPKEYLSSGFLTNRKKRKSDEHELSGAAAAAGDDDPIIVSSRSFSSGNETEASASIKDNASNDATDSEHVFHFFAPVSKPKRKKQRNADKPKNEPAKPQPKKKSRQSTATNNATSVERFFSGSASRKTDKSSRTPTNATMSHDEVEIIEQAPLQQSSLSSRNKPKAARKQTRKTFTEKGDKSTGPNASDLEVLGSSLGVDSEQLLAQQRVAEFQAKRMAQQQPERERRKKREQNAAAQDPGENIISGFFAGSAPKRQQASQLDNNTAGFFSGKDAKTLKSEHIAAEFQVKRRAQQQKERERRIKREKATAQDESTIHISSSVASSERNKRQCKFAAPRFPKPSHVFPLEEGYVSTNVETMDWKRTKPALMPQQKEAPSNFTTHFPPRGSPWSDCNMHMIKDPISSIFHKILSQSSPTDRALDVESPSNSLLAEKYGLSRTDVDEEGLEVHQSLKDAARELRSFVDEWKVHRFKANQRMVERQLKLRAKKRIVKKRGKRKSQAELEDELWGDEDDTETSLRPLFVLSGPVSCGKSSLVYAVAEQCECRVIEINTSDKRGGASIKQMLEEATLSHSSMDLLENKRQQNLFSSQLVDSDDDDDSENESEEGANLALILIDEVDLLFEQHGDNAFWSALGDIAKRTKCPIVLTANQMPHHELRNYRFRHVEMSRPSQTEFVARMKHILKQEGFHTVDNSLLKSLAKQLNGDLRRFCNELQSYQEVSRTDSCLLDSSSCLVGNTLEKAPWEPLPSQLPMIESITPKSILGSEYNILTLKGRNFLSLVSPQNKRENAGYVVQAQCGDQLCPDACIMDDETAFIVTAPFQQVVTAMERDEIFDDDTDSSIKYYNGVSLHSLEKRGLLSTTDSPLEFQTLGDGSQFVTTPRTCSVEVVVAEEKKHPDGVVQRLMNDEVNAWLSRNSVEPLASVERVSLAGEEMDEMERFARIASDAAVLENEFGLGGTPYLAGPTKGFGFELTAESSRHINSKNPSESKLFDWGWKDDYYFHGDSDSFMCDPVTPRERNYLRLSEKHGRGQSICLNPEADDQAVDQEDFYPPQQSEEDFLLPLRTPAYMLDFPTQLFGLCNAEHVRPHLQHEKTVLYKRWVDLFDSIFFYVTHLKHELFARGLGREVNAVFHGSERFDPRIVLDYIPILRRMALHESAADRYAGHTATDKNQRKSRPRRASRRGNKSCRDDNYFGIAFGEYYNRRVEVLEIHEITKILCSSAMGWREGAATKGNLQEE